MSTQPTRQLSLTISEQDFQRTVIDTAILHGWLVHHSRPARTARGWATPLTGHPGLPDLVLARDGVVLLCELKRHGGKPTIAQTGWLAALGDFGRLWTPAQWESIKHELKYGPTEEA